MTTETNASPNVTFNRTANATAITENTDISLNNQKPAETNEAPKETFQTLCKQLGSRINSTENALLCLRAYRAYLVEHPETGQGKGNKSDRDPNELSFRHAAAEASGVSAYQIDALLQVGKAIEPLPEDLRAALVSSSLGMRTLRKLAPKRLNDAREKMVSDYLEHAATAPEKARAKLEETIAAFDQARPKTSNTASGKAEEANEPVLSTEDTASPTSEIIEIICDVVDGGFEFQLDGRHVRITLGTLSGGCGQAQVACERVGAAARPSVTVH